jgi:hypothetical protein
VNGGFGGEVLVSWGSELLLVLAEWGVFVCKFRGFPCSLLEFMQMSFENLTDMRGKEIYA